MRNQMAADPFHVLRVCVESSLLGINIHDSASFWRRDARFISQRIQTFKAFAADDFKLPGLYSSGPEQDSSLFATVILPGEGKSYFPYSFNNEHPSNRHLKAEDYSSLAAPLFCLEFSGLGPVVTCKNDEQFTAEAKAAVSRLERFGFYFIPFSKASEKIDSAFADDMLAQETWYSRAFGYM